jgi:hypothetical protein
MPASNDELRQFQSLRLEKQLRFMRGIQFVSIDEIILQRRCFNFTGGQNLFWCFFGEEFF